MVHLRHISYRFPDRQHGRDLLLSVELLDKHVHAANRLLESKLAVLSDKFKLLFRLGLVEFLNQTFNSACHGTDLLSDASACPLSINLAIDVVLRFFVDLLIMIDRLMFQNRFQHSLLKFVEAPPPISALNCRVHTSNIVRRELQFQQEPFDL